MSPWLGGDTGNEREIAKQSEKEREGEIAGDIGNDREEGGDIRKECERD